MNLYSFSEFIDAIKNLDYHEILKNADTRCWQLEHTSRKEKDRGGLRLADNIKGLLFWLKNGQKPNGLYDWDFILLKPVCKNLIQKKQLKPEALDIFTTISISF